MGTFALVYSIMWSLIGMISYLAVCQIALTNAAVCSVNCRNGGWCVDQNRCQCPWGYTGRHCETQICNLNCQNGGWCEANRCRCPWGYTGYQCETRISSAVG